MLDERQIRLRGWILVVLGCLLSAGMIALLILITPIILLPSPDRTNRFSGDTQDAIFIFSILYLVLVFGLASAVAGISQIRSGQRNWKIIYFMLVLALMLYVFAMVVRFMG